MSTATLTRQAVLGVADAYAITIDCPHGTTTVTAANGVNGLQIDADAVSRLALLKHQAEEGCRCTRKHWRRVFGCGWPDVPIATAQPTA